MTELKQIYRCEVCGNVVEMERAGAGVLVCCGKEMVLEEENRDMTNAQKHIPVIIDSPDGLKIVIGEILHPMTEEHHIEWVQVITPYGEIRRRVQLGEEPIIYLPFLGKDDVLGIRSYCNVHGMYVS